MNYKYIILITLCLTSCKQAKTKKIVLEKDGKEQNGSKEIKTIDLETNFRKADKGRCQHV